MAKIVVFLTNGTEEVEALTVVDLARRAGIETDTVTITDDKTITGSHGIPVILDKTFEQVNWDEVDMIVLPGGMPGTLNLKACKKLTDKVQEFFNKGKAVAAVCAAPTIPGSIGILKGRKATCFPGYEDELLGAEYVDSPVVADGNVITSKGLGTTIAFSGAIIEYLIGKDASESVLKKIQYK